MVYPKLRHLFRLLVCSDEDSHLVSEFKTKIRSKMSDKFGNGIINGKRASIALIATGLDPRKKNLKCLDSKDQDIVKDAIVDRAKEIIDRERTVTDSVSPPAKRMRHCSSLISSSDDEDEAPLCGSSSKYIAMQEFEQFRKEKRIPENVCPLKWWQDHSCKYPHLSAVAKQVLAIPATSTTSERVFSTAGLICNKLRASLAPQHVNMLTFLAKNRSLYSQPEEYDSD
jgi:hypothetical protein